MRGRPRHLEPRRRPERRMRLQQVSDGFPIAQERERFFQALEVVWANQHSCRTAVARHNNSFVLAVDAVDELGKPIFDVP